MAKFKGHNSYLRHLADIVRHGEGSDRRVVARTIKHLSCWQNCESCVNEVKRGWLPTEERTFRQRYESKKDAEVPLDVDSDALFSRRHLHDETILTVLNLIRDKWNFQEAQAQSEERHSKVWELAIANPDGFWRPCKNEIPPTHISDEQLHAILDLHGLPNFTIGPCDSLFWDRESPTEVDSLDVRKLAPESVDRLSTRSVDGTREVSIHGRCGEMLFHASEKLTLRDCLILASDPSNCFDAHPPIRIGSIDEGDVTIKPVYVLEYTSRPHELPDRFCQVLSITVHVFPQGVTVRQWVDRYIRRRLIALVI